MKDGVRVTVDGNDYTVVFVIQEGRVLTYTDESIEKVKSEYRYPTYEELESGYEWAKLIGFPFTRKIYETALSVYTEW